MALSACESPAAGSKTAAQIVRELQGAASTASSVHIAGSLIHGNQETTIDVGIKGDSAAGYLGVSGTRFYVLSLNGQSYVKLNAAFLNAENAPASLCATICGKYVALPAGSTAQLAGLLSMRQLDQQIFLNQAMSSTAASGCVFSPATVQGQSVLRCRQGENTLDVAARGRPYVLYWSGPNGQHLAFSGWNSVELPAAPPPSQVVAASALG